MHRSINLTTHLNSQLPIHLLELMKYLKIIKFWSNYKNNCYTKSYTYMEFYMDRNSFLRFFGLYIYLSRFEKVENERKDLRTKLKPCIVYTFLSTDLPIFLSTDYLSFYLPNYLSFYLPITYLSIYRITYLSIYRIIYLSIYRIIHLSS